MFLLSQHYSTALPSPERYDDRYEIPTGLDPHRDRIRLLTVATERGVWLVDCFEVDPRPLFPVLAEKELIIHNALFDLGFLAQMGFEPGKGGGVLDTMLLSQMVEDLRPEDKEDA